MLNILVMWQIVYIQAALDHLAANGHHPFKINNRIPRSTGGYAVGRCDQIRRWPWRSVWVKSG